MTWECHQRWAMWLNKEGRFGVMDTHRGEIWHPLADGTNEVRAMRVGMDSAGRSIFTITFVGAKDVEVKREQ